MAWSASSAGVYRHSAVIRPPRPHAASVTTTGIAVSPDPATFSLSAVDVGQSSAIIVSPTFAAASFASINPAVAQGGLVTIAPTVDAGSEVTLGLFPATLNLSGVTVSPNPATMSLAAQNSPVALGGRTILPGVAALNTATADPVVTTVAGATTVVPTPATFSLASQDAPAALGGLSVVPVAAASSLTVGAPTTVSQSGVTTALPGPAVVEVGVFSPTLVIGTVVSPTPATFSLAGQNASVALGGRTVIPIAATLSHAAIDAPVALAGTMIVSPFPAVMSLAARDISSVTDGGLTVSPIAAAANMAGAPQVVNLRLTASPTAAAMSLATPADPIKDLFFGGITVQPNQASMSAATSPVVVAAPGQAGFYRSISNLCRSIWALEVEGVFGLPTQYDNLRFVGKPESSPWARVVVEFESAEAVEAGGEINHEARGAVRATLYSPVGAGIEAATTTADSIMVVFRERSVPGTPAVDFLTPRMEGRSQEGAWWRLEIACPFYARKAVPLPVSIGPAIQLSSKDVHRVIRNRWKNEIETTAGIPTQYEALPFTKPSGGGQWARLTIQPGDSFQVDRGGNLSRTVGIVVGQVWTPAEMGERLGLIAVDSIVDAFRHRSVQGLVFGSPQVTRGRRQRGEWVNTVTVPWSADMATV